MKIDAGAISGLAGRILTGKMSLRVFIGAGVAAAGVEAVLERGPEEARH